jgi:Na+/glutamate symporter
VVETMGRAREQNLWPSRTAALALIAEVSLGVFLAMSLMRCTQYPVLPLTEAWH